ncbi:hypothetical protein KC19_9G103200 [Ceratodon purpureus]|uniref:Uncharacterized protein n=1 Tax=Ceratodon purpureus TaxID=3225 RepID=A0A8T0GW38_CERPU|nr:hypothetical protein KC19_9G103200 [Ceratodon purpureus]
MARTERLVSCLLEMTIQNETWPHFVGATYMLDRLQSLSAVMKLQVNENAEIELNWKMINQQRNNTIWDNEPALT